MSALEQLISINHPENVHSDFFRKNSEHILELFSKITDEDVSQYSLNIIVYLLLDMMSSQAAKQQMHQFKIESLQQILRLVRVVKDLILLSKFENKCIDDIFDMTHTLIKDSQSTHYMQPTKRRKLSV